jgi:hypothetical protein
VSGPGEPRRDERLALLATLLLALATVCTAWSSYQASRWHGEQALAQSSATSTRLESTRASGLANREVQVDVAVLIQWVDAHAAGDVDLAEFYEARFSDRLRPAFRAWIAQRPFDDPDAESDPFALSEYEVPALDKASELEAQASADGEEARENIQRADNYVRGGPLRLIPLLRRPQHARPHRPRACRGPGHRVDVLVCTAIWIATFPVTVST